MMFAGPRLEGRLILLLVLVVTFERTLCQPAVSPAPRDSLPPLESLDDVPGILELIAPVLLPKVLPDEWILKTFIRSDEFAETRAAFGDAYSVDVIFRRAQRISWNNTWGALFITLLATMDHRRIGLRVPPFGALLWFPLTSEFEDEYQQRRRALPRFLTPDSPPSGDGDADKLQHFFGSAFLAFCTESGDLVESLGPFIEKGERLLVVGGTSDDRDINANLWGVRFGLSLRDDPNSRPSSYLRSSFRLPPAGNSGSHILEEQ